MTIFLILAGFLAVMIPLISYICYRMAFHNDMSKKAAGAAMEHLYGDHYEYIKKCMDEASALPFRDVWITSFDGLRLHGRYYEYSPDSPIELMLHGYRGNAMRDLSCGILRGFQMGHSVLLIDQRSCGESEGKVITFGIYEHKDALSWLDFMIKEFGNRKIMVTGVSMGASTALIVAGQKLPENVIGVLADCGFSSPKEIIHSVIRAMRLPPKLMYPFVKLGAKLYGGFDLEALSSEDALRHSTVPVLFFHGEEDTFVPCFMSKTNYKACASRKRLVTIPKAGHCLCYPVDPDYYLQVMKEFFYEET